MSVTLLVKPNARRLAASPEAVGRHGQEEGERGQQQVVDPSEPGCQPEGPSATARTGVAQQTAATSEPTMPVFRMVLSRIGSSSALDRRQDPTGIRLAGRMTLRYSL